MIRRDVDKIVLSFNPTIMTASITCLKSVINVDFVCPNNSAILVTRNALSNSKERLKLKEDIF